jgi:hypothetical protein
VILNNCYEDQGQRNGREIARLLASSQSAIRAPSVGRNDLS